MFPSSPSTHQRRRAGCQARQAASPAAPRGRHWLSRVLDKGQVECRHQRLEQESAPRRRPPLVAPCLALSVLLVHDGRLARPQILGPNRESLPVLAVLLGRLPACSWAVVCCAIQRGHALPTRPNSQATLPTRARIATSPTPPRKDSRPRRLDAMPKRGNDEHDGRRGGSQERPGSPQPSAAATLKRRRTNVEW